MKTRFLSIVARCAAAGMVIVCSTALAQQPTEPQPAVSIRVAEGKWNLTPIVTLSSDLPDTPGARILEFGNIWLRNPDEIVFWGRIKNPPDPWAFFSWKGGQLRTLVTEGEEVVSKYAAPGMTDKLHVHREKGWHLPLKYWNGKLGYLVSRPGKIGKHANTYTWDGSGIKRLIGYGDMIAIGEKNYRVSSAEVESIGRNGAALLLIFTDQPKRLFVHAAHEGTSLTPLFQTEPLPFPYEKESGFSCAFLVDGPALIACPVIEDPGISAGIYSITPAGKKRLIGVGDVKPVGTMASGASVALYDVLGPDQFIGTVGVPFVFGDGRIQPMRGLYAADQKQGRWRFSEGPYILTGKLLDSSGPASLFFVVRLPIDIVIPPAGEKAKETTGQQFRFDYYLFDGTSVTQLTSPDKLIDETSGTRRIGGDYPAILVHERLKDKDVGVLELSLKAPKEGLQPPLLFNVGPERSVSLADVIDWRSAGQAVVRQKDGIYLLKREP